MDRFEPAVHNRVRINTIVLADYHVNYILATCRELRIPIICIGADTVHGYTSVGSRATIALTSNGITAFDFGIRKRDLVEFILRFGNFVERVVHLCDEVSIQTSFTSPFNLMDNPDLYQFRELESFRNSYEKRWRL